MGDAIAPISSCAEQYLGHADRNPNGEGTTRIRHHLNQGESVERISFHASNLLIKTSGTSEAELPTIGIAQETASPPANATQTHLKATPVKPPSGDPDSDAAQPNLAQQPQRPIANLASIPLGLNTNFGVGEVDRTALP